MRFKSNAVMQGSPELTLRARTGPVDFQVAADGSVKLAVGPLTARVDEVPVTLTIPFLRRGGGVRTIATVGPFSVRLNAVDVELRPVDARVSGVVGKDGLDGNLEGKIGCRTELDVEGTIPGKVAKASFEMVEGHEESGS